MKKFLCIVLAMLMLLSLAACGKDKPKDNGDGGKQEVKGEIFDAGNVQALAPKGWKAFPANDVFAEDENATDPDVITICKGAKSSFDMLTNPLVRIDYYGPDTELWGGLEGLKEWYTDVKDLESFQCGKYTWEGFTTTDYGLMAILVAVDGETEIQVSVYLETDGGKISLEDEDVQAILASIQPSGK